MDTKFKALRTCLSLVCVVLIVGSFFLSVDRNVDITVPTLVEPKPFVSLVSFSDSEFTSTPSEGLNGSVPDVEEVDFYEEPTIYSGVYQQRINRIHQVCLENNLNTNSTSTHTFLFSKKHRLVAKQVPKVGTTTVLTTFHILTEDRNAEKVLQTSRMHLHGGSSLEIKMDDETLKKYTLIFPSRNPYTRLYSAFIDKVYIFNSMGLVNKVLKHAGVKGETSGLRKYEVTFQMFLDYALDQSLSSHALGYHYNTLFNRNTWLCSLDQFFIIKQETFSADLEYALKAVKVEKGKMEVVKDTLYSRRAEISVITILKTVMQRRKGIVNSMGQSKNGANVIRASVFVLTRLWKSFQIQGYIATKSNFPLEKFLSMSSVSDVSYVLSVFLEEIKQHPLTQSDSKQQRQLAMLAAYDNIRQDTVKKIQKIYKLDFDAFEYNIIGPE